MGLTGDLAPHLSAFVRRAQRLGSALLAQTRQRLLIDEAGSQALAAGGGWCDAEPPPLTRGRYVTNARWWTACLTS